jgi:hypothetical protein
MDNPVLTALDALRDAAMALLKAADRLSEVAAARSAPEPADKPPKPPRRNVPAPASPAPGAPPEDDAPDGAAQAMAEEQEEIELAIAARRTARNGGLVIPAPKPDAIAPDVSTLAKVRSIVNRWADARKITHASAQAKLDKFLGDRHRTAHGYRELHRDRVLAFLESLETGEPLAVNAD